MLCNTEIPLHTYFTPYSDMAFLSLNILLHIDCYIPIYMWDLSIVLGFVPLFTSFMKWFRTPFVLSCALKWFRKCIILQNWKEFDKTLWAFTKKEIQCYSLVTLSILFMVVILIGLFFSWIKLSNFMFF